MSYPIPSNPQLLVLLAGQPANFQILFLQLVHRLSRRWRRRRPRAWNHSGGALQGWRARGLGGTVRNGYEWVLEWLQCYKDTSYSYWMLLLDVIGIGVQVVRTSWVCHALLYIFLVVFISSPQRLGGEDPNSCTWYCQGGWIRPIHKQQNWLRLQVPTNDWLMVAG